VPTPHRDQLARQQAKLLHGGDWPLAAWRGRAQLKMFRLQTHKRPNMYGLKQALASVASVVS
jgi:hypothetical protein